MTNYEIIEDNTFWDEEENQRRAELKAHSLLQAWRSRFPGGERDDVPVANTYSLGDSRQIELESRAAGTVRVTRTHPQERSTIYEFGFTDGRATLTVTGPSEDTAPSLLDVYEDFSRLLFDCDRAQTRG